MGSDRPIKPGSSTAQGTVARASAYWQLMRPRIVAMVLLTITVAALVAAESPPDWLSLVHALLGSTAVIVGAIALNQRIEHTSDCKMPSVSGAIT